MVGRAVASSGLWRYLYLGGCEGLCSGEWMLDAPSDKLVEDFNVFAQLFYLGRFFGIEYGEGAGGRAIVDVATSWLNEATDEEGFEESICIFEEFEG